MTFIDFAAAHGLVIDSLREGRWVRVKTTDKPKKRNGSYKFLGDIGFVQNHATMESVAVWRDGARAGFVDKSELRARAAITQAQEKARQYEARERAEDMVKRAAVSTHPYLAAKGFPTETGLVLEEELLIPMREFRLYKQINSLQRISPDGKKLFLPGGKAKGSVFFIGPYMAHERWLVEGYATGLSVRAALRELHSDAQVVVCFSASNLAHVGRVVSEFRSKAFVVADNDASNAGEEAAEQTGLMWGMPGDVGTDANDMHQRHGIRALAELLHEIRTAERVRSLRAG